MKLTVGRMANKNIFRGFDRDNYDGCVIHLISHDSNAYDLASDDSNTDDLASDDSNTDIGDSVKISRYVTDHIPDIWNDLRVGDIVFDLWYDRDTGSWSPWDLEKNQGLYYVESDTNQSDGSALIKNGLRIVQSEHLIPSDFYAVTRFGIGYHDYRNFSRSINYKYISSRSELLDDTDILDSFNSFSYRVPLDRKKLKLDSLTEDNVFEHKFSFNERVFFYIVITYKDQSYLIGAFEESMQKFIDSLNAEYYSIYYGDYLIDIFGNDNIKEVNEFIENELVESSRVIIFV
jgi:hypothetical protein